MTENAYEKWIEEKQQLVRCDMSYHSYLLKILEGMDLDNKYETDELVKILSADKFLLSRSDEMNQHAIQYADEKLGQDLLEYLRTSDSDSEKKSALAQYIVDKNDGHVDFVKKNYKQDIQRIFSEYKTRQHNQKSLQSSRKQRFVIQFFWYALLIVFVLYLIQSNAQQ